MKSAPLSLSPLPPSRVHWGCRRGSPSEFGVQSSGGIRLGLCGDTGVPEVLGVEQGLGGLSCEGSFAGPCRAGASLDPASWEGRDRPGRPKWCRCWENGVITRFCIVAKWGWSELLLERRPSLSSL